MTGPDDSVAHESGVGADPATPPDAATPPDPAGKPKRRRWIVFVVAGVALVGLVVASVAIGIASHSKQSPLAATSSSRPSASSQPKASAVSSPNIDGQKLFDLGGAQLVSAAQPSPNFASTDNAGIATVRHTVAVSAPDDWETGTGLDSPADNLGIGVTIQARAGGSLAVMCQTKSNFYVFWSNPDGTFEIGVIALDGNYTPIVTTADRGLKAVDPVSVHDLGVQCMQRTDPSGRALVHIVGMANGVETLDAVQAGTASYDGAALLFESNAKESVSLGDLRAAELPADRVLQVDFSHGAGGFLTPQPSDYAASLVASSYQLARIGASDQLLGVAYDKIDEPTSHMSATAELPSGQATTFARAGGGIGCLGTDSFYVFGSRSIFGSDSVWGLWTDKPKSSGLEVLSSLAYAKNIPRAVSSIAIDCTETSNGVHLVGSVNGVQVVMADAPRITLPFTRVIVCQIATSPGARVAFSRVIVTDPR